MYDEYLNIKRIRWTSDSLSENHYKIEYIFDCIDNAMIFILTYFIFALRQLVARLHDS